MSEIPTKSLFVQTKMYNFLEKVKKINEMSYSACFFLALSAPSVYFSTCLVCLCPSIHPTVCPSIYSFAEFFGPFIFLFFPFPPYCRRFFPTLPVLLSILVPPSNLLTVRPSFVVALVSLHVFADPSVVVVVIVVFVVVVVFVVF